MVAVLGLDMFIFKRDKDGKVFPENIDTEWDNHENEFIYWRKANAIHLYLVKNIQNGVDNCDEYPISHEELISFYNDLVQARLTRDPTIFPPGDGFFFGGVEVDEYYWNEIRDTIEKLKPDIDLIKKNKNSENIFSTYFYQASW
jgi:hypothetical protein